MESSNARLENLPATPEHIPPIMFEGHVVSGVKNVVRGSLELDSDDALGVDDRLTAKVVFRVVGVQHTVDSRGDLIRTQVLKPILSYVELDERNRP